jgi:hypothetical protein
MVIIPGVLAWMGQIGAALLTFVVLLIAACLRGWHEQIDAVAGAAADIDAADTGPNKPEFPGQFHRFSSATDRDSTNRDSNESR